MANKPKANFASLLDKKAPILNTEPKAAAPVKKIAPVVVKKAPVRKPRVERADQRVQAMLTQSEFDRLAARAGDVPMSKYLRSALRRAGEI